jgi:hypothetical protein
MSGSVASGTHCIDAALKQKKGHVFMAFFRSKIWLKET